MINFLFSFKEVGGVPTLFFNVASEMHRRGNCFRLISYLDSEIFRLFSTLNCEHIDLNQLTPQKIKEYIEFNDVLVITNWIPELMIFKEINPRILLWNVFPFTLRNSNILYKNYILHKKNRSLITKLLSNNSIIFMDHEPFSQLKNYGFNDLDELLVPIPITIRKDKQKEPVFRKDQDYFTISYIGRAVNWKIFPLIQIIKDLNKFKSTNKLRLIIVTDNGNIIQNYLNESIETNLIYRIEESLSLNELAKLLDEYSDLNIGMGTTCLESASLKIPTLMVKASYNLITDDKNYKWLYHTKGFSLGTFNKSDFAQYHENLTNIVSNLICNKQYYLEQSEKCYNYVRAFHSIEAVTDKFITYAQSTTLTFNEVRRYIILYSPLYKYIQNIRKFFRMVIPRKKN